MTAFRHRIALPFAALFALAAGSLLLPAQTARDSAGIQIIDNAKPLWTAAQTLRLSNAPTLVIGTQDGEQYELSRVRCAVRVGSGRIVVADGGSNQLRFFDSTGKFIKVSGIKGSGPGEFQRLEGLSVLPGDTIVAMDGPRTPSFFTGAGVFINRLDIAMALSAPEIGKPLIGVRYVLATLSGELRVIIELTNPANRSRGARWIAAEPVKIYNRDNTVLQSLGALPATEYEMMEERPQYTWLGPTLTLASNGNFLFNGFGNEYSIRVYTRQGKLTRIIRRKWTPVPISRKDISTFVVEWSKRWVTDTGAKGARETADLADDPYAKTVPAFSAFIADRVGRLWVRAAHIADAPAAGNMQTMPLVPTEWSVFSDAGQWLGDVTMPAQFLPTDIGANYVLGIARDADGVQTVVKYGLAAVGAGR